MMKQSVKHFLDGMLLLAMPLMMTSCEGTLDDVFGEWSRPTGQQNNQEPTKEELLSDLSSALEEGAIVSITYTIDGVEYTSTFEKVGDEYIKQSPATTRTKSPVEQLAEMVTIIQAGSTNLSNPDEICGVNIQIASGEETKLDVTVNVKTNKQTTNFATEGSALQSVQVNDQKADLVNTETGYAGVQSDDTETEGDKLLGGIPFTEGDTWENTADIKQENGGQYLQVYEDEDKVYFSANGYTGYLEYENKTPVRPKDKVGKKSFYLKLSGAISYKEKSWGSSRHKVVESIKTVKKYQLVTDSKLGVTWKAGTYVVNKNVTIKGAITCNGNIKLFLSDGCKLRINGVVVKSRYKGKYGLTIYGNGTGKLVNSGSIKDFVDFVIQSGEVADNGIIDNINVTMYGGKLSAKATGSAINTYKRMTVYGGELEVISDGGDAIVVGDSDYPGTLTVYGGKVTASAPNGQAIKGYFAKGKGTSVWFFESDDGVWSEPLGEDDHTTTAHYFKAEVDESPAEVSGTE